MSSSAPQWYFNAASNPFSPTQTPDWKPYSAADNAKIEQEFQKKAHTAELQQHMIHFQERMQVHKSDFNRQRPIKREPKA